MRNRKKRMLAYEASEEAEKSVEEAPKSEPSPKVAPEPKTKKKKSLFGKG